MADGPALSTRPALPRELIYAIIDIYVLCESRKGLGIDGLHRLKPDPTSLRYCTVVSKTFYNYLAPVVFRLIRCSSRAQVRSLYERITENPALAPYIREFYIQQNGSESCWLHNEPMLPLILRALASHCLEGFSIEVEGLPRIGWDVFSRDLKSALHQVTGSGGHLQNLRFINLELSDIFMDGLSDRIRFLELSGVTRAVNRKAGRTLAAASEKVPSNRIFPMKIETLSSWASAAVVMRLATVRGDCGAMMDGFPCLTKIILDKKLLAIERSSIKWLTGVAPKLESIRLSLSKGHFESFLNVNELTSNGPFRHLEFVQVLPLPHFTFPDASILSYLSTVTHPSKLESVSIIVNPPNCASAVPPNICIIDISELDIVLDNPLYSQLRCVTFDFTSLSSDRSLHLKLESSIMEYLQGRPEGRFSLQFRI